MTAPKRKPGRPRGSSRHAAKDRRYLDEVADLLSRDPKMKKCRAIARVVEKHFPEHQWPAAERRLQRGWNRTAVERVAEAEQHRRERYAQSHAPAPLGRLGGVSLALATIGSDPALKRAMGASRSVSEIMRDLDVDSSIRALSERAGLFATQELSQWAQERAALLDAVQPAGHRMESLAGQLRSPAFQEAIEQAQGVLGGTQLQQLLEQIDPLRRQWGF